MPLVDRRAADRHRLAELPAAGGAVLRAGRAHDERDRHHRPAVACSNVLVSWMAGGLAQVCIVLSTLMGGVSGSAVADAAMEARILGPDMIRRGYSKGFTCRGHRRRLADHGDHSAEPRPHPLWLRRQCLDRPAVPGRRHSRADDDGGADDGGLADRRASAATMPPRRNCRQPGQYGGPLSMPNGRCSSRLRCLSQSAAASSRPPRSAPSRWSMPWSSGSSCTRS